MPSAVCAQCSSSESKAPSQHALNTATMDLLVHTVHCFMHGTKPRIRSDSLNQANGLILQLAFADIRVTWTLSDLVSSLAGGGWRASCHEQRQPSDPESLRLSRRPARQSANCGFHGQPQSPAGVSYTVPDRASRMCGNADASHFAAELPWPPQPVLSTQLACRLAPSQPQVRPLGV
jgi:hypothetical protein